MKSSNIGGQAVLEGIMMKHKDEYAVAVRKSDGEIIVEKKTMPSFLTAGVKLFPKVQINKRVKDASAIFSLR